MKFFFFISTEFGKSNKLKFKYESEENHMLQETIGAENIKNKSKKIYWQL